MKRIWWIAVLIVVLASLGVHAANAQTVPQLQIGPMLYEETLDRAESKRGVVDVTNPTTRTVDVQMTTQAFRQIDDEGTLEFYDDEAVDVGVALDLDEFELSAGETMRVVFELDASKLPSGDVFAAIFANTRPETEGDTTRLAQSVRVGTLLVLENGTPPSREVEVTELEVPLFVFDGVINGQYRLYNSAQAGTATGFFPEVTLNLSPFHDERRDKASLLFAGRERDNDLSYETQAAGIYRLSVTYDDSSLQRYVVLLPPWSLLVLGGVMLASVSMIVVYRRHRAKLGRRKKGEGWTHRSK